MWKNLKISTKLLLGFGVVLFVFVASVFAMWRYVKVVDEGCDLLVDTVVPILDMATEYNNRTNEIFMAARSVQYTESQEAIANYKEQLTNAVKIRMGIAEMNKAYPEFQAPAHIMNVVVPLSGQYVGLFDNTIALIAKKRAAVEVFDAEGGDLSDTVREMARALHARLASSIKDMGFGTDKSAILALENALFLTSDLAEKIMALRRDSWHAISVAQFGGGVGELRQVDGKIDELQKQAEELKPIFNTQEEKKILEKILSDFMDYGNAMEEVIKVCIELDQLHQARVPLTNSVSSEIYNATLMALGRVRGLSTENIGNLSMVLTVMMWSTIVTVVLSLMIAFFISRSISKPLNMIVNLAKRAGEGDLTIKKADFGYEGRDEMGSMVGALADMVEAQNSAMTQVVEIAGDLANGAGDLSSISEETNAAMEEIKASVFQVSVLSESNGSALEQSNAGVEEMSAGADTVAHSATDSASFIAQTSDASNKAVQTVRNVIEGMRDVDKNAKESEAKTRQLVSSVENVSSFVSVITGIADQTNLLALNAAIEAARAGEVGRGFAVVAEEVRKLAEESARAAQNVNGIIKELQTGAKESIKVTTEAGRLLVATIDNADNALEELNGALTQMNKANDSIQNIAAVAEEQAASSREVAQAIDSATKSSLEMVGTVSNIQRATDETAQSMEGVAKQAAAMTTHAKNLSDILSMYKLKSAHTAPAAPTRPIKNTKMLKAR